MLSETAPIIIYYRLIVHSVYDVAFKPDGSQLIVAAGLRVLVRAFLI